MSARQYRKRPVVVEAIRFAKPRKAVKEFCPDIMWVKGQYGAVDHARIKTLEGDMIAYPGDYIIRGVQGEFYSCKADIFEATYEAVTGDVA